MARAVWTIAYSPKYLAPAIGAHLDFAALPELGSLKHPHLGASHRASGLAAAAPTLLAISEPRKGFVFAVHKIDVGSGMQLGCSGWLQLRLQPWRGGQVLPTD